jgi:hypothetical protein
MIRQPSSGASPAVRIPPVSNVRPCLHILLRACKAIWIGDTIGPVRLGARFQEFCAARVLEIRRIFRGRLGAGSFVKMAHSPCL